jgi:creatinine amidohydrolase
MMAGYHLFNELTRERLNELAPEALVVLPVGATEQHGPHLPVGTDHFAVERVARQAARAASERITAVVTPTLPFGSSEHHLQFGGTLSFSTETYYRVLVELVESLVTDGFRQIFILNGHGGNSELIQLAARDVALRRAVSVAAAPYWTIAWDELVAAGIHKGGRMPGHAGRFETSLILADRPELVVEPRPHRDLPEGIAELRVSTPFRAEHHGFWTDIDGYTDSPDLGTAEIGNRSFDAIIGAVAEAFVTFAQDAEAARS